MAVSEESWTFVGAGKSRPRNDIAISSAPSSRTNVKLNKHSSESKLLATLARHLLALADTGLWVVLYDVIKSLSTSHTSSRRRPLSVVCLGLGPIVGTSNNGNSVVQLSGLLLLQRLCQMVTKGHKVTASALYATYSQLSGVHAAVSAISKAAEADAALVDEVDIPVLVSDPLFTSEDRALLLRLGLTVTDAPIAGSSAWSLEDHIAGNELKGIATILYMPHCPVRLTSHVLRCCWSETAAGVDLPLQNVMMIGNTLGSQDSSVLGDRDCIERIVRSPHVRITSVPVEPCFRPPAVDDEDVAHVYLPPFSSTSVHTFEVDGPLGTRPDDYFGDGTE